MIAEKRKLFFSFLFFFLSAVLMTCCLTGYFESLFPQGHNLALQHFCIHRRSR